MIKRHALIALVFFLGLLLRFYAISSQSIVFWYDQARDFSLVKEIISGDLKIQGPSASGTGDIFYHGVLYYYYILPWVFLGGGEVVLVNSAITILATLAIFLVYYLSFLFWKSRAISLLASLLLASSFFHIELSTWLSNPQMLTLVLPIFYYFLFQIFIKKNEDSWIFAGLGFSLGLCFQAGIFEVYLLMPVLLVYLLQAREKKSFLPWSLKNVLIFSCLLLLTVSSMLLTQYLLFSRGILDLKNLSLSSGSSQSVVEAAKHVFNMYSRQIKFILSPSWPQLTFLFLLPVGFALSNLKKNLLIFFIILFTAPAWLLAIQNRDGGHLFIGLEVLLYMLLAFGFIKMWSQNFIAKSAVLILLFIFFTSNLLMISKWRIQAKHYFYPVQTGAFLSNQLELVNYTYKLAEGKPFSISTSTNPFLINVTWGYLYNTYGLLNYGYLPVFIGSDQTGIVGANFLPTHDKPELLHFSILEPETGLNEIIMQQYFSLQDHLSTLTEEINFGSLILQVRQAK